MRKKQCEQALKNGLKKKHLEMDAKNDSNNIDNNTVYFNIVNHFDVQK